MTVEDIWFDLIDQRGVHARAKKAGHDPSSLEVVLPAGERLFVASALVRQNDAGSQHFDGSFEACLQRVAGGQVVVPVFEEHVEVKMRSAERERLRLVTRVTTRNEPIDLPLMSEELSIERIPIGRIVQQAAGPRQDGDTLIVPIYEESIVVEKRLVLKEEVHVTRTRRERHEHQEVELRREELSVERLPPETQS